MGDLYDLGYKSSVADPDVWLRPAIKEKDGFKYWEYVLCYVEDLFVNKQKSDAHHERHTTKVQV